MNEDYPQQPYQPRRVMSDPNENIPALVLKCITTVALGFMAVASLHTFVKHRWPENAQSEQRAYELVTAYSNAIVQMSGTYRQLYDRSTHYSNSIEQLSGFFSDREGVLTHAFGSVPPHLQQQINQAKILAATKSTNAPPTNAPPLEKK